MPPPLPVMCFIKFHYSVIFWKKRRETKSSFKYHTQFKRAFPSLTLRDSDFGWAQKKFRRFQHKTLSKYWSTLIHLNLIHNVNRSFLKSSVCFIRIVKRVHNPNDSYAKPLRTLSNWKSDENSKDKAQKRSAYIFQWFHCEPSIFDVTTDPIIGTHWDGSMNKLRRVIIWFNKLYLSK